MGARVDKIEYQRRIFIIQGWIVDGIQSSLICRQILSQNWCQSQRHAERMLKKARESWTEIPEAALDQKRKLKVARLEQIVRNLKEEFKSTPAGVRAIMSVEKEIIMLDGLRKPTKVELTGKDGAPIQTEITNAKVVLYIPQNGRDKPNVPNSGN